MKNVIWGILLFLLALGGAACGKETQEQPDQVIIRFFYNEPCATCNGAEEFYQLVSEEIADLPEQYPYQIQAYNVFHQADAQIQSKELKALGYDQEFIDALTSSVMTVNGKAYLGMDSIRESLKEAYLTAGEDLFVYGRGVYDPLKKQSLKQLLSSYPLEKGSASIVYFYRTTCEECIQTEQEAVDTLPQTVTVDGKEYPLQTVRINTRSGRNNEVIQAFFEKYGVPEEDQMVPIVFTAKGYLAGYEEISSGLLPALEAGDGLGMVYPK